MGTYSYYGTRNGTYTIYDEELTSILDGQVVTYATGNPNVYEHKNIYIDHDNSVNVGIKYVCTFKTSSNLFKVNHVKTTGYFVELSSYDYVYPHLLNTALTPSHIQTLLNMNNETAPALLCYLSNKKKFDSMPINTANNILYKVTKTK